MAVDFNTNKHMVAFPSKVASASGSPHQWDILLEANTDNGVLVTLGAYVSHFNYKVGTAPANFEGKILEQGANGNWYIQVVDADDALLLYNSPVSPYNERILREESAFYNANGDVVRGYELIKNDIFEISAEGFNGTPAAGATVSFASGKYVVA